MRQPLAVRRPGNIVVSLGDELEKLNRLADKRERKRSWILRRLIDAEYRAVFPEPPRPPVIGEEAPGSLIRIGTPKD